MFSDQEVDKAADKTAEKTGALSAAPSASLRAVRTRQLYWARHVCTAIMAVGVFLVIDPKGSDLSFSGFVVLLIGFTGRYYCQRAERRLRERDNDAHP